MFSYLLFLLTVLRPAPVPIPGLEGNISVTDFSFHYNARIRYAAITVTTTLNENNLKFQDGIEIRDAWENWFQNEVW